MQTGVRYNERRGKTVGGRRGADGGLRWNLSWVGLVWALWFGIAAGQRGAHGAEAGGWEERPGYRVRRLTPGASEKGVGFVRMDPGRTGITFTNILSDARAGVNRILENGSGVALGDVDGDGRCDVYFCRLEGGNVLYRNLGDWRFEDVTERAGVACADLYSFGAVLEDVDGDRDLDLIVTALGAGARLFLNDGKGVFSEVAESGLLRRFGATSMALADIDGDQDLDLYVANYRATTYKDRPPGVRPEARMVEGRLVVKPEDRFTGMLTADGKGFALVELGEPDILYVNKGRGRFGPISWTGGAFVGGDGGALKGPPLDWSLSVMLRDFNGDRTPDIYVCNDFQFSRDTFWFNEGGRRFRAVGASVVRNMSQSSMAIDVADINRDGWDDFFVGEMLSRSHVLRNTQRAPHLKARMETPTGDAEFRPEVSRNTLYLNRGDGTYAEIAQLAGVAATEWTWGVMFLDVDLDGYEDLLVANGNNHDVMDADAMQAISGEQGSGLQQHLENLVKFPRLRTGNLAYRNGGNLTFADVSDAWGFGAVGISQGMACADLDGDGDLDVVMNNLHEAAGVYRNDSTGPRVAVRLVGVGGNTRGIGAKIEVLGGGAPRQSQEMISGGRYLSSDDAVRVFAAGKGGAEGRSIRVTWRNGRQSRIQSVEANCEYEVLESGADVSEPAREAPKAVGLFEDRSQLLREVHRGELWDEFERQPLLSRRLGATGPGLAWVDWNGDGWDDLAVAQAGVGEGGVRVYLSDGKGGFSPQDIRLNGVEGGFEISGLVGLGGGERGGAKMWAGLSNYREGDAKRASVISVGAGREGERAAMVVRGGESAVGSMALGDVDGDGEVDLFVAGRGVGGRYPEGGTSHLLRGRGRGAEWKERAEDRNRFAGVGLVNGALLADLEGDGYPELILACEWGPVRIYRNRGGTFEDATEAMGLAEWTGWWNGVVAGDFDGDGRLDLAVSNWGRNTPYQAHLERGLSVSFGDFDRDGRVELFEGAWDRELGKVVPFRTRDVVGRAMPGLVANWSSFRRYGEAGVEELLRPWAKEARVWKARTLDSMIFLNRGARFEARAMPVEAQMSPAFGMAVADWDGDGRLDLVLAQNFFQVEPEQSRYDAGRGLWLRGLGNGEFESKEARESGISLMGEQRACAVADWDGDGRPDLSVSQYRGPVALFRNGRGKAQMRVELAGPNGNPSGLGARVWWEGKQKGRGPAQVVGGGGGWLSQSSAAIWVATEGEAGRMRVQWPGGRESVLEVEAGAKRVRVPAP